MAIPTLSEVLSVDISSDGSPYVKIASKKGQNLTSLDWSADGSIWWGVEVVEYVYGRLDYSWEIITSTCDITPEEELTNGVTVSKNFLYTHLSMTNSTEKDLETVRPFSFDDYLLTNLPKLYREKIVGNEQYRLLKYLTASEDILNTIYSYTKKLGDAIDINEAHPKYLYQLGRLLGLTDLIDLTYSDDTALVAKQRKYVRETLDRLLLKGTPESIIRLYYGLGVLLSIRELWTVDFSTLFETDDFTKKYLIATDYDGDYLTLPYTYQGYISESFSLVTDIVADIPAASGISEITQYERNNFNFYYVLTNTGLYFKDFNDTVGWLEYSETLQRFELVDDKIFILGTDNVLRIYYYNNFLEADFSISSTYNFSIVTVNEINYLLSDLGTKLELRNLTNYSIISAVNKPTGSSTMTDVVNKEGTEHLIFDTVNKTFYAVNIGSGLTLTLTLGLINYSNKIPSDTTKTFIRKFKDNVINIFTSGATYSLSKTELVFSCGATISYGFYIIPTELAEIQDIYYHSAENIVFYISADGVGIYNINNGTFYGETAFSDAATYDYKRIFFLDNFYLSKTDGVNPDETDRFHGLTLYVGEAFKTHYFDLLLDSKTISSLPEETIATINETIKLCAPIHTNFRGLFLNYSLTTESVAVIDQLITSLDVAFALYHNSVYVINMAGDTVPFYHNGAQQYDGTSDIEI